MIENDFYSLAIVDFDYYFQQFLCFSFSAVMIFFAFEASNLVLDCIDKKILKLILSRLQEHLPFYHTIVEPLSMDFQFIFLVVLENLKTNRHK